MADKFMDGIAARTRDIETLQQRETATAEVSAYFHGGQRLRYRVMTVSAGTAEEHLNDLGAEGWRLVSALPYGDAGVTLYLERAERTGAR